MSGLEALSLACGIFQVITFARDTIQVAKKVYENGSFEPSLGQNAEYLDQLVSGMTSPGRSPAPSPEYQRLFDISRKCQTVAKNLTAEIARTGFAEAPGNWLATAKTTARVLYRGRKLRDLEAKLADLERTMQSGLLERTFQATHDVQFDVESLDASLHHFIDQYQKGYRSASDLISREAVTTRQVVQTEAGITRDQIDANQRSIVEMMDKAERERDDQRRRKTFLESFQFDSMEERRNQITESHDKTFRWVFHENRMAGRNSTAGTKAAQEDEDINDGKDDPPPNIQWDDPASWLESKEAPFPFYWVNGKPGSGKTTLVKYILDHARTMESLKVWDPNPAVISHFIWKLGGVPLQKNLKGLLCSLAYQLLRDDPDVLQTLAKQHDPAGKKNHTDWSVEALTKVVHRAVQEYERSICIFIDGVDELEPQHHVDNLFDITDSLKCKNPGKVKIFIASRAEPVITRRLGQGPRLRLQDLTDNDIARFVRARLALPPVSINDDEKTELVRLIVSKSEGVFLWAHLVVANLARGFNLEDDYNTLMARITRLPDGLKNLYQDMWARMNEDDGVYQDSAATYLRLMLSFDLLRTFNRGYQMSPLLMVFATDQQLCRQICESKEKLPVSISELKDRSKKVGRLVEIRSAGFVEQKRPNPREHGNYLAERYLPPLSFFHESRSLKGYVSQSRSLRFIHRTAKDFLCDTQEGLDILTKDEMQESRGLIHILNAYLACSQLFGGPQWWKLEDFFVEFAAFEDRDMLSDPSTQADAFACLDTFLQLCERGRVLDGVEECEGPTIYLCGHDKFSILAAEFGLKCWIFRELEKETMSADLMSRMLLNVQYYSDTPGDIQKVDTISRKLLLHGAQPNYDQQHDLEEAKYRAGLWSSPRSFHRTPWTRLLLFIFNGSFEAEVSPSILSLLKGLAEHGADLGAKMNLVLEVWPTGMSWVGIFGLATARRDETRAGSQRMVIQVPAVSFVKVILGRLKLSGPQIQENHETMEYLARWIEMHTGPDRVESVVFVPDRPEPPTGVNVEGAGKEQVVDLVSQCLEFDDELSGDEESSVTNRLTMWCQKFESEHGLRDERPGDEEEEGGPSSLVTVIDGQGQLAPVSSWGGEYYGTMVWFKSGGEWYDCKE